jgi:hypothetical protein
MKLGQFDQREQAGGMGSQGQIRIAQIQQLRALVLQVGQINPAVSGLGETLVGIARKAQIARWARMALDLAQDPAGFCRTLEALRAGGSGSWRHDAGLELGP